MKRRSTAAGLILVWMTMGLHAYVFAQSQPTSATAAPVPKTSGSTTSTGPTNGRFAPALTPMTGASAAAAAGGVIVPTGKDSAQDLINTSRARDTVTGFDKGGENANKQLFQNGRGVLVSPGGARVSACANKTDPECVAVQLMDHRATTAPLVTINKDDPLLGAAQAIKSGATVPIDSGGMGINPEDIAKTVTSCKTTTTDANPVYETKICDVFSELPVESQCKATRIVAVDQFFNYQCQTSTKKEVINKCQRRLDISVTKQANCQISTLLADNGGAGYCVKKSGNDVWFATYRGAAICDLVDDPQNVRLAYWTRAPGANEHQDGLPGCGGGYDWHNLSLHPVEVPKKVDKAIQLYSFCAWPVCEYIYVVPGSGCTAGGDCTYTVRSYHNGYTSSLGTSVVSAGFCKFGADGMPTNEMGWPDPPPGATDCRIERRQICRSTRGGNQCNNDLLQWCVTGSAPSTDEWSWGQMVPVWTSQAPLCQPGPIAVNDSVLKFKAPMVEATAIDNWVDDCKDLVSRQ